MTEPRKTYRGEHAFPLILQNVHRYFLYLALLFLFVLAHDVWKALWFADRTAGRASFGIALGTIVLAIAMVVLRGRLLLVASVLSVLFMAGTLLALVLALTVGLFGIHEVLTFQLVPTTLVVESIGAIVLAVTTALVFRRRHAA